MAVGLMGALANPIVSAEPVTISSPVTGTFDLNGNVSDLSDVVFQGTLDDVTGELVGKLVFPTATIDVTDPVVATISLQITQPADGTGLIDPTTDEATFTANLVLSLTGLTIAPAPATPLAPCTYTIPLALTGMRDPATNMVTLTQEGFAIAVNPADAAPRCAGLNALIDPRIVGSNNTVDAVLDLNITNATPPVPDPEPTPTPTPTPAPAPAPAPPAPMVLAQPIFTG
jgi:hypothetical protein